MTRTVTGGQYRRVQEAQSLAVANETTVLQGIPAAGGLPPRGTVATATLVQPPHHPYAVGDGVVYEDSNNHNTVRYVVTQTVGPSKYQLRVT